MGIPSDNRWDTFVGRVMSEQELKELTKQCIIVKNEISDINSRVNNLNHQVDANTKNWADSQEQQSLQLQEAKKSLEESQQRISKVEKNIKISIFILIIGTILQLLRSFP